MTTYIYRVTMSDGELIAVKEALERYRTICQEQLVDGPKSPYWAHLRSLDGVLARLHSDAQMMSTSSPCWPQKPNLD